MIELSIVILIIGSIVAGITQSSRLVSQFKLNTARTLTQSSPVASIKDLRLWLEATSESSFTESETNDGDAVTTWYDINPTSGARINASSSSTARPTYKKNCINGLPCLNFDGTNDYMDTASNSTTTPLGVTVFAVVVPISTHATTAVSIVNTYGDWTTNAMHFQFGTNSELNLGFGVYSEGIWSGSYALSTQYIMTGLKKSGSNIYLYKNGTEVTNTSNTGTATLDVLNIGSYNNGTTRARYCGCYFGEVIIFTRGLKTEERTAIESYLSKKWGIKLS